MVGEFEHNYDIYATFVVLESMKILLNNFSGVVSPEEFVQAYDAFANKNWDTGYPRRRKDKMNPSTWKDGVVGCSAVATLMGIWAISHGNRYYYMAARELMSLESCGQKKDCSL